VIRFYRSRFPGQSERASLSAASSDIDQLADVRGELQSIIGHLDGISDE
jgi:hypothetical protein